MTDEERREAERLAEQFPKPPSEMGINLRIGFIHGYAAACEAKRAENNWNGIKVEPSDCKMCRTNLNRAKEVVEAERTRSSKLVEALSFIVSNLSGSKLEGYPVTVRELDGSVSQQRFETAEGTAYRMARRAIADYEASCD